MDKFTTGRIGRGVAVHVFLGGMNMCGTGQKGRRSPEMTGEDVTCQKCLTFLESYKKATQK